MKRGRGILLGLACALLPQAAQAGGGIDALADRYIALRLKLAPAMIPLAGIATIRPSELPLIDLRSLAAVAAEEDRLLKALQAIDPAGLDPAGRSSYALMIEGLEASRGLRVCHQPLWGLNHIGGWQIDFQDLAEAQPVGTAAARADALRRWGALPRYIDQDIANLRSGLAKGYSAPRSVVTRVIGQIDKLIALPVEQSPFYSPAARDGDAAFKAQFRTMVADGIYGALRRYRDFLSQTYLAKARENIALSTLPDGAACYQALLRANTSLDRTPAQVKAIGEATVARNIADIAAIGQKLFGVSDLPSVLKAAKSAPDNRFTTAQELVDFSNQSLARTIQRTATAFVSLPKQPAAIEVLPEAKAGSGIPAHYIPESDPAKPGRYILPLDHWRSQSRGEAEVTVVHETLPGHHLQIALTQELAAKVPLLKIEFIGSYVEGWARYSERLAEDLGVYQTPYAAITRRAWMARGMVVDPGIHMFGWSREQAIAYLVESGHFDASAAADMLDRIAVIPGQLTAYDSGGLEIAALRAESEKVLGRCFDLKAFHQQLLGGGALPLKALRSRIEQWRDAARTPCTK